LRAAVTSGPDQPEALLDSLLVTLAPPSTDDVTVLALART
jgi:hypothetical protein